ncbi:MAG: hypothetical protein KC636_37800, partial [Myxococcales bacterium]|nr:hypothetical protein [Myxococcales bacterium]
TPGDPPPASPPAPAPATDATPDSDAPIEEGPSEDEVADAPADAPASSVAGLTSRERPPRVDGAYVGGSLGGGLTFARVNDLATPTPFFGPGGFLRVGEVLYPWMTLGVNAGAIAGFVRNQLVVQGAFLIEAGFLPVPKRAPLSILVGFGAGGGAVHEQGAAARSGFGGAAFKGALRYDFFPGVNRRRPSRGGGFSLGPELGWLGFTPAAAGRPMSNVLYLSLWIGYYFGS